MEERQSLQPLPSSCSHLFAGLCCSELSSSASTPFVSAPSSPSTMKSSLSAALASPPSFYTDSWPHTRLQAGSDDDDDGGAGISSTACWPQHFTSDLKVACLQASNGGAVGMLQAEDSEFAYSENSLCASAAISTSSRILDLERAAYDSICLAYEAAVPGAVTEEQIRHLPPPACLTQARFRTKQQMNNDLIDHRRDCRSLSFFAEPTSPRSPWKLDIRGVFSRSARPEDAFFDRFLKAIQKSMERRRNDFHSEKAARKESSRDAPFHRRTLSSCPLKFFNWDDYFPTSNSYFSNHSMDNIKRKHPIQREIDARYNAEAQKGSKKWSLRGLLYWNNGIRAENARHSNTGLPLSSSSQDRHLSSISTAESFGSPATGEVLTDAVTKSVGEDMIDSKFKDASRPVSSNFSAMAPSLPPMPVSTLLPSASDSGNDRNLNAYDRSADMGSDTVHHDLQPHHTQILRARITVPYKRALLGCLRFSSRGYRAIATASKHMQSVTR